MTEQLRHLDVGGLDYGSLVGVVFLGLAQSRPDELFCIADIHADEADKDMLPPNLSVSVPKMHKIPYPFLTSFKLDYPNNFFDDARMDMVLDVVMPDVALKMLGEIRRCLKPGGTFSLVDEISHQNEARLLSRLSFLRPVQMLDTAGIYSSGYLTSQYTNAFHHNGHELFLLKSTK